MADGPDGIQPLHRCSRRAASHCITLERTLTCCARMQEAAAKKLDGVLGPSLAREQLDEEQAWSTTTESRDTTEVRDAGRGRSPTRHRLP